MDTSYLFIAYLLIGFTAGFLGGLFGIGGGLIVVPALVILFEYTNPFGTQTISDGTLVLIVVGTSMASIIFTAGSASLAQFRKQNLDWKLVRDWVPLLALSAFVASWIAELLPAAMIKILIGVVLLGTSVLLLFNLLPSSNRRSASYLQKLSISTTGGFVSGLVGLGGGNFIVPSLMYFNYPSQKAVAVANVGGLSIALFATTGYIFSGIDLEVKDSLGYVYLPALIPIALMSLVAAPLGVQLGQKLPPGLFKRFFGVLMIIVALRMFYSVF